MSNKKYWVILVPMQGTDQWFPVCECTTADSVAATIKTLLTPTKSHPTTIKVEERVEL